MRALVAATVVIASLLRTAAAHACGGAEVSNVAGALEPVTSTVGFLVAEDPYWDAGRDREPFRFLDAFRLENRASAALLAQLAYGQTLSRAEDAGSMDGVPRVDLSAFDAALGKRDWAAAKREAARIADAVLSMATPVATVNAAALRRAVEFLELEPHLGVVDPAVAARFFADAPVPAEGRPPVLAVAEEVRRTPREGLAALLKKHPDHPRAPSLELAVLRERMRVELDGGWAGEMTNVSEAQWKDLEAGHDKWLANHRGHPLADLARLQKLRVLYLRGGQVRRVWDLALELYARRPARGLWEMRHLLVADVKPEHLDLAAVADPVLATALVRSSTTLAPAQWDALWKRAAAQPAAAWSQNLQLRLLAQATRIAPGTALPAEFPAQPAKPSELWAQLRTAALLQAGKAAAAVAQAELLDANNPQSAMLAARAFGAGGDWTRAAMLPALDAEAANYLLEVVLEDSALEKVTEGGGPRASRAAKALARRRLDANGWEAGANTLERFEPANAKLWHEAAKLAQDETGAGRLAFARWLRDRKLFPAQEPAFSRGLKARLDALSGESPAGGIRLPDEKRRLEELLLRGGSLQRSLEAYADALQKLAPASRDARAALKEADQVYNRLLNWDASYVDRYPKLLAASPPAAAIRAAAKAIRKGK